MLTPDVTDPHAPPSLAAGPWLDVLSNTPLITRSHLDLLEDKGIEVPAGMLVPATAPVDAAPTGETRELYELAPAARGLVGPGTPSVGKHHRRLHRDFGRRLAQEVSNPEVPLALRHAWNAEDWETVHRLWVRHGLGLITRSLETTAQVFGALPEKALRKYPFLRLGATVFDPKLLAHDGDDRRATIQAVSRRLLTVVNALWSNRNGAITLHLLTGQMIQQRTTGALGAAVLTGERIDDELRHQTERGGVGDDGLEGWCRFQVGMTGLLADRLDEARASTLAAYGAALSGGMDSEYIVVNAAAQLAVIFALEGMTAEAERWAAISERHQCHPWFDRLVRLPARIARSMIALDRLEAPDGLVADADEESWRGVEMWPFVTSVTLRHGVLHGAPAEALIELESSRANHPVPRDGGHPAEIELLLAGPQADALTATGQSRQAVVLIERLAERIAQPPETIATLAVPYARALLHCGDTSGAWRVVRAVTGGEEFVGTAIRLEASFLLVEILVALGDRERARETFRFTRQAVDKLQLWRLYAVLPRGLLAELASETGVPLPAQFLAWSEQNGEVFLPREQRPSLTRRELIVLQQLVSHSSPAAIATELTVSVNTVKTQISSLYRKLGVGSRQGALAAASRFGFLDDR